MKSPMERRLDLGLKQRDVAKVAKVACSSVSRMERNLPMHQSTRLLILRAMEALETEQLTKMCAEEPDNQPMVNKFTFGVGEIAPQKVKAPKSCRACHGTGIVWSPDGKPWKCPYCGEEK